MSFNWIHLLDGEGETPDREQIGGKAWSLARMSGLGLRVPPAFVIRTSACSAYFEQDRRWPDGLRTEIQRGIAYIEQASGRAFGGESRPLLLSVRSGAAISMPGMMDTVLNLGINHRSQEALARESGDPGFAADTRRRFCELFARIVMKASISEDADADAICKEVQSQLGVAMAEDPMEQLVAAVTAVFDSSRSRRAVKYRKHNGLPADLPTAVTVQAMVFGNLDEASGTGVLFSRNPLSGAAEPYGEYLAQAQGEDVVSGSRTPQTLSVLKTHSEALHAELLRGARVLEEADRDMQDIEFTIEEGQLYFLQSRIAKRSAEAAIRCAVDFVESGKISPEEAFSRLTPEQIDAVLKPRLKSDQAAAATVLAKGEPACPGIASGKVVSDCDEAERLHEQGQEVVLCRSSTSPEDLHGMIAAMAVVTERGGSTSHAAVVGRQLGKPSVVGCGDGVTAQLLGKTVTVDGSSGQIFEGRLQTEIPQEQDHPGLRELAKWAKGRALRDVVGRTPAK